MDNKYCRPEWIEEQGMFTCSECGVEITKATPECHICGSHMTGYDDAMVKAAQIPDGIPENIKLRLMSTNASIMSKSTEVTRGKVAGTFFCKNCGESVTKITANCPHCRYRFENYRYISDFITENKKIGLSGLTSVLLGYMSDHKEPSDENNGDFNVTRVLIPGVNVHKKYNKKICWKSRNHIYKYRPRRNRT